jgi:uncharacterized DUF497 family protein
MYGITLYLVVRELKFTWDSNKNRRNQRIHGIAFEDAKYIFQDPQKIIIPDINHSKEHEERWNVIGIVDRVLFVVYVEEDDHIRIISARIATKKEREVYHDSNINT